MIKDIVQSGIEKVSSNKNINLLETIALSMFIGTGDINKYKGLELFNKLNSSIEYTNYRNFNTILSNDGSSFIVGEIIPYEIIYNSEHTQVGVVVMNIESICLPATEDIDGNDPIDVLMHLDEHNIVDTLRNTFKTHIPTRAIKAKNKNDFIVKINDRINIENTDIIFYSDNKCIIVYNSGSELLVRVIDNFDGEDYYIADTNNLDELNLLLGGNNE